MPIVPEKERPRRFSEEEIATALSLLKEGRPDLFNYVENTINGNVAKRPDGSEILRGDDDYEDSKHGFRSEKTQICDFLKSNGMADNDAEATHLSIHIRSYVINRINLMVGD